MEWYEKVALYAAFGYTMFKFYDIITYFKTQINDDEELIQ